MSTSTPQNHEHLEHTEPDSIIFPKPLDVWLKFDREVLEAEGYPLDDDDPDVTHEANTFLDERGYYVEWYLVDVGHITIVRFDTYEGAKRWLEREGFEDFSS